MRRHQPERPGLTLIELLVVVAIIGVVASLVLPAVIQTRSAARKAQCSNNLKQLATGIQQFHNRQGTLPAYWGTMKGSGGEKFGGWLLHLLPDLEQQAFYDALPVTGTTTRYTWGLTGRMLPAVPESDPYVPGIWVTSTIGWITRSNISVPIIESRLEGQVGTPGITERPEWGWVPTAGSNPTGLPDAFAAAQSKASLTVLNCGDDPADAQPGAMIPIPNTKPQWIDPATGRNYGWSLSNYMANVHVFTKLMGGRLPTSTPGGLGGLFPSPLADRVFGTPGNSGRYHHGLSATMGTATRQFAHITDGLTNTILFGEGMRQCDGGASYRFAFLPDGYRTHEHGFGVEPSLNSGSTVFPGSSPEQSYGNTLVFQTQPGMKECNPFRTQAMHGPYLMVAMCDGSIRAISSLVSRREPIGSEACGRAHFGTIYYTPESRGAGLPDGIWDMLMVPADPPGNVLANTGEIGKEK
jgi:prepilin-type N-terminal cleavage/methylation domain-containing protein